MDLDKKGWILKEGRCEKVFDGCVYHFFVPVNIGGPAWDVVVLQQRRSTPALFPFFFVLDFLALELFMLRVI